MFGFGRFGRVRQKARRLLAAVAAGLLLGFQVFSAAYIVHEADHDCRGEGCPVCVQLKQSCHPRRRGRRHFGCRMDDAGGCACCSKGFVLEFDPSDSDAWATNWPSIDSPITVSGRLEMIETGDNALRQPIVKMPRLVDATVTTSDGEAARW